MDLDHLARMARPRLSDAFDLAIPQESVHFAIPYLREDRPFCLDPFLMWKSQKEEYRALHGTIEGFLNRVRKDSIEGRPLAAMSLLSGHEEARELGLGYGSGSHDGTSIGPELARRVVLTFQGVPQLQDQGMTHLEALGLLVPGIAEDRLSDLTAALIGEWLAWFTKARCEELGIPTRRAILPAVWSEQSACWRAYECELPWNPLNERAVLFAPLDLLRRLPWINYEDYYKTDFVSIAPAQKTQRRAAKEAVLAFNRQNYERVQRYISRKEEEGFVAAGPHPLFEPLKLTTIERKIKQLRELPVGREDGAEKKYEQLAFDVLSTLLYPELDLAKKHARTDSGAHIVDVIFHNDGSNAFLLDLRNRHEARQIVWELKNVRQLETEHVNQVFRYLDDTETGRVGVLLTRYPAPANVLRNTVDLYSSKRYFVLCADDRILELMLSLARSGRRPIEAFRKLYVDFTRTLPR